MPLVSSRQRTQMQHTQPGCGVRWRSEFQACAAARSDRRHSAVQQPCDRRRGKRNIATPQFSARASRCPKIARLLRATGVFQAGLRGWRGIAPLLRRTSRTMAGFGNRPACEGTRSPSRLKSLHAPALKKASCGARATLGAWGVCHSLPSQAGCITARQGPKPQPFLPPARMDRVRARLTTGSSPARRQGRCRGRSTV